MKCEAAEDRNRSEFVERLPELSLFFKAFRASNRELAEIKGRDKSPFFRRIIHFFTFLYSVGVKEYILLNVLQK